MEIHFETKRELIRKEHEFLDEAIKEKRSCIKCERKENQTLDHIVPRAILIMMGIDVERWWDEENVQILCRGCNMFKGERLDFSMTKTKKILLRYLNKL